MRQKLRLAAACASFTLCLLSLAFWSYSYSCRLRFSGAFDTNTDYYSIESWEGYFSFYWSGPGSRFVWRLEKVPAEKIREREQRRARWNLLVPKGQNVNLWPPKSNPYLFDYLFHYSFFAFMAPYWLLVAVCAVFTVLFKPSPKSKFSLREFLVVTTLTAVALGCFTLTIRAAGAEYFVR